MAGGAGSLGSGEPEFQVAPMVDVLLTLLVFFMMITSAQVLKVDRTIELPVSKNALKKETNRSEVVINVGWDSKTQQPRFTIDDKTYTDPDTFVGLLSMQRMAAEKNILKQDGPPFRAVIRGDRDCPAIHISHAMNSCAQAGIADISFSAVNKR